MEGASLNYIIPNVPLLFFHSASSLLFIQIENTCQSATISSKTRLSGQLASEARKLGLSRLAEAASPSTITIACHAALSAGRLNPEVTFRKILRIVVSGKVTVCRTVFTDTLNECRDGGGNDFEEDRYTSRFFLKHNNLEKAFDNLATAGFVLIQSNTFSPSFMHSNVSDETQFLHHSQYVFQRRPQVRYDKYSKISSKNQNNN